jgi:hypothetical protein
LTPMSGSSASRLPRIGDVARESGVRRVLRYYEQ